MFADSLLDSSGDNRLRRSWTTLASFLLQSLAVSLLLLLPLTYTEGMPQLRSMYALVAPVASVESPPVSQRARPAATSTSEMLGDTLLLPPRIPPNVSGIDDQGTPPPPGMALGPGVPYGLGTTRSANPLLSSILNAIAAPPPRATAPPRVSRIMEGNLVHRVQPQYPPLAIQARIQGPVVLRAVISKEGAIENLQVVSGHPMLVPAAIEAVRQWRYRPYYLNSEPVEVETQVTVNFVLSGG